MKSRGESFESKKQPQKNGVVFRTPKIPDGKYFWEIAKTSKVLDVNSLYHYLIICRHFGKTCIAAEKQGHVIGFVTAYIPPGSPDSLFVWQVAVDEKERGQGVGLKMLTNAFNNLKELNIKNMDTTITPSNQASINLFTAVARELNLPFEFEKEFFSATTFGQNNHEPEILFHIGSGF
ncbi:MAG: diaminobutyrate acetyltransferase [Deltaproteobacteria bacterium]|nr:diaminobutyrate acetyltransferase [Deltaproteobacteria bacterium]